MRVLLGIPFLLCGFLSHLQMSSCAATKAMPTITSKAFTSKLQAVIQNKDTIYYAIEKYDETQNKSSLSLVQDGTDSMMSVIFDYADQTVLEASVSLTTRKTLKCQISSMKKVRTDPDYHNTEDMFHYFGGWSPSSKKIPHLFSSKYIFSLNNTVSYMGTKTIDGIQADYWSSNMVWPDDNDRFEAFYYFTSDKWMSAESSYKNMRYPLRIEILGTKKMTSGAVEPIHHYYEYLYFATGDRLPADAFEVPDGAICYFDGATSVRTMPNIPDMVSYSREVVDSKGNVNLADVVYDKNLGVMQVKSAQSEILYDFNSGVRYQLNNKMCDVRAIDPNRDHNVQKDGSFIKDIGPAEFWFLNNSIVYTGQRHSRLIGSYSYSYSLNSKADNDIFDVHFGKMNWNFSPDYYAPPLSMDRDGIHYNFFNFKNSSYSLRTNSLWALCRSFKDKKLIKITFLASSNFYPLESQLLSDVTIQRLSDAIAEQAGLAKVQVHIILHRSHYDSDNKHLYLYVELLGPPAPKYMYRREKKQVQNGNQAKPKKVRVSETDMNTAIEKSTSLCEENASGSVKCRNFDLCKNADGSYDMKMYPKSTTANTVPSSSCDHFDKNVDNDAEITLENAVSKLQQAVTKGQITLNFKSRYSINHLSAVEMSSSHHTKIDEKSAKSKFKIYFHASLIQPKPISATSSENCANQCLNNDYECKGFEYCYGTKQCLLSANFPKKDTTNHSSTKYCLIFWRNYIADFQAMPGRTLTYKSKAVFNTQSSNDCAMRCIKTKQYPCESFNYCEDSHECVLSRTHVYNAQASPVVNISASCTHYSKNYLLGFDVTRKTALSSDSKHTLETVSGSTPEQCAYLCRTGYDGKGCVQFDYCSDKKICQIANGAATGYVTHVPSAKCDTFRMTNAERVVASGELTGNDGTTYSNATFGGLAVGLFLLGLAIGAAIIFLLHRQRYLSRFIV